MSKKRQKSSKSVKNIFDTFDIFRAGQNTSKIVKKRQKVFRHFPTIFARHHFSGPFWGALMGGRPLEIADEVVSVPLDIFLEFGLLDLMRIKPPT